MSPLLYLWTHRGASRHCKILDTEKAWEQFDNLEEAYFNPQSSYKKLSALEQLKLQNQAILEVDEKVDAVNNDLQEFKAGHATISSRVSEDYMGKEPESGSPPGRKGCSGL